MTTKKPKKPPCPKCGAKAPWTIRYGLASGPPPKGTIDGGCCIDGGDPAWQCRVCGERFGVFGSR
jgi:hypothetical protein